MQKFCMFCLTFLLYFEIFLFENLIFRRDFRLHRGNETDPISSYPIFQPILWHAYSVTDYRVQFETPLGGHWRAFFVRVIKPTKRQVALSMFLVDKQRFASAGVVRQIRSMMVHTKEILGAVHKIRSQSGGREVCPVRTFCGQGRKGSSDADVRIFGPKSLDFRNLWCVQCPRNLHEQWKRG